MEASILGHRIMVFLKIIRVLKYYLTVRIQACFSMLRWTQIRMYGAAVKVRILITAQVGRTTLSNPTPRWGATITYIYSHPVIWVIYGLRGLVRVCSGLKEKKLFYLITRTHA